MWMDKTNAFVLHRFRWAYCQLQQLRKLKSTAPKYVKLVLGALPITLDDTYSRMLLEIEEMYHHQALILLQWLAYAQSPPTLSELVEAAIIDPAEESPVDVENRGDLEDTLNILSGLVIVERTQEDDTHSEPETGPSTFCTWNTDTNYADTAHNQRYINSSTRVRLVHFSVKEFLESKRILESNACYFHLEGITGHRTLAQSCLAYLQYYNISSDRTSTKQDFETFSLLRYAAKAWFYHSALQNERDVDREVSLLQQKRARSDWLLIYQPDVVLQEPFQQLVDVGPAIYYASFLGLLAVVSNLLCSGADANVQGGYYGSALQAASWGGHTEIVQLLLSGGADVNAHGGYFGNAIKAASYRGCADVVQLLLDGGANADAQGRNCVSALHHASPANFVDMFDDRVGYHGNALRAASHRGHTEVVRLLLDRGADVNAQGEWFGDAIKVASTMGHTEVVQLLLLRRARVESMAAQEWQQTNKGAP
jgi:hypothetical protein